MKAIDSVFQIPIPNLGINPVNTFFNANVNGTSYTLTLKWFFDNWNLWVTFPDGDIRQAGMIPGVFSWSEYSDFAFFVKSNLEHIGQNDLDKCALFLAKFI